MQISEVQCRPEIKKVAQARCQPNNKADMYESMCTTYDKTFEVEYTRLATVKHWPPEFEMRISYRGAKFKWGKVHQQC